MKKKTIVLITIGSVLALSFVIFGVLLIKFNRGEDPNNEDAILAEAKAAEAIDDPPKVAGCYRRLIALNPFNKDYVRAYYHSLVRVRDFETLAAYTNDYPVQVEFTEKEKKIEELLDRGAQLVVMSSNTLAAAVFAEATNLNYYAAAPLLIRSHFSSGQVKPMLDLAREYVRRFPRPSLLVVTAEWCTLAKRTDLLAEVRADIPTGVSRVGIMLAYYCDALEAWDKQDYAAMVKPISAVGDDIMTPLAQLMKLDAASVGDDAAHIEHAYREFRRVPSAFDFPIRAKLAVKRFIAAHFGKKYPIDRLGKLADLIMEDGVIDVDVCRVSLLAKMAAGVLPRADIERALSRFPDDKGLKLILERYDRDAKEAK